MDKSTVFVKTQEGEEAMRQRTRLVQRNLRNILIMVDGQADVGDLAKRFGDEATTQAALRELLAGGFIAEQSGQLDFTTAPAAKANQPDEVPVLTSRIPAPVQAEPAAPEPAVEEIHLISPEYESLPPPPLQTAARSIPATAPVTAPGWLDRMKALFAGRSNKRDVPAKKAGKDEQAEFADVEWGPDLVPARRGTQANWPMLGLSAAAGIAVLLGLTLSLYPYGRHLPDIERNAAAMLQEPVKIGDIGFSFLPRPHIALRNIVAGNEAQLRIASVRATPDFLSLLGERKVFHDVVFAGIDVKESALAKLARAAAGNPPVKFRHIAIEGLSLVAGDARLGGIGGEVKMSPAGTMEAILLHDQDNALKMELRPKGEAFQFVASGSNWKPPFAPNLVCQSVDAAGELRAGALNLDKLETRAYEGLVEGKASLAWSSGPEFNGDLEIKHINSGKLLAALGSGLSAEGELSGRLKLAAKADSLGKLADAVRAEGSFEMKRGIAKGLDLGEAVRKTGRDPTRGGETKFEQLSGTVQVDAQEARLGNLRLASGLMTAAGNLGVGRNGQLNGLLNVDLKSSAATLRVALAVGGTSKDPMLTPSRR